MNCQEYRQRFDTDPDRLDAEARAHRDGCPDCTEYAEQGGNFEAALGDALRIATPPDFADRVLLAVGDSGLPTRSFPRRRIPALAALLLLGILLASLGWRMLDAIRLERELSAYVAAWPTEEIVASPMATRDPNGLLRASAIEIDTAALNVRVAKPCIIRGTEAVHLLIEDDGIAVSVIVMPAQSVAAVRRVRGDGQSGVVIPCPRGSVAILAAAKPPPAALVERVRAALHYR